MTLRGLGRRVHRLFHRVRFERAMDDEIRHHIELETRAGIERGLSDEEARRRALIAFGGVERFKEDARDRTGWRLIDDMWRDLRFAARAIRRRPGFAIAAGLTLALGIGMTATIFSLVQGVLLAPLPYAAPERLVVAWERNVSRDGPNNVVSVPNFELWHERARSFELWHERARSFELWHERARSFGHLAGLVPMRATLLAESAEAVRPRYPRKPVQAAEFADSAESRPPGSSFAADFAELAERLVKSRAASFAAGSDGQLLPTIAKRIEGRLLFLSSRELRSHGQPARCRTLQNPRNPQPRHQ